MGLRISFYYIARFGQIFLPRKKANSHCVFGIEIEVDGSEASKARIYPYEKGSELSAHVRKIVDPSC